ncbi:hypothetical protein QR98_0059290 [Sarcoptes scabiei]|uniref:Uncharacterized protein n=1 Tax=Sarcoptes scabiei TaxID=52283 RepID=A0A132AA21_SARSC|nr:hypothetical protein QR98_0059290 [Sarcoptes scabiei]
MLINWTAVSAAQIRITELISADRTFLLSESTFTIVKEYGACSMKSLKYIDNVILQDFKSPSSVPKTIN